MEHRILGGTGIRVSAHCLGSMMFGGWGNDDPDDCVRIIHRALDAGINFVDTADVYSEGASEEIVGRALRGRRDDVVLATKVHGQMGPGANQRGNSRVWIVRELEASLRRLGTDHVDLYQLHRPDPAVALEDLVETMTGLVRQGKIRHWGTSANPAHMLVETRWAAKRGGLIPPSTEQCSYSVFVRSPERDVFDVTQRHRMGVLAYSPLAGGWLAGRYRRGEAAPEDSRMERSKRWGRRMQERFDLSRPETQRRFDLVERLEIVAEKAGVPLAHLAVAFTLSHPAVTSAIIGPRTMAQLEDLVAGADVRLDADTLDAIDAIVAPGTLVDEADRGWEPPWMEPGARRQ